ncbi:MAG: glycosyltransferase family 2 protein [Chloroflexota bacterium]
MKEILVVILNWRQAQLTLESLSAMEEMEDVDRCDFLVIDNGSQDGSTALLEKHTDRFELLTLPENLGFGRGNNVALALAIERGYRHTLLINNDAFPHKEMLSHLLAEAAPDIGLLAPKMYYDHDRERVWFFQGRMQKGTLNLRDSGQDELDRGQFSQSRDCDYLLGTCLLVNMEAVTAGEVGIFDDRFFMYYEDIDWSIRMQQAGYRLRAVADSHLYHRVAASSGGSSSPLHIYYLTKSAIIFFRKHYRQGNLILISLYRIGNGLKLIGKGIRLRDPAFIRAYLRGVNDGLRA